MLMCQLNLCYTMNTQKKYNQEEGMQLLDDPFLQKWRLCRPEENYGQYPLIIQKLLKSPCDNTDEHEPCTLLPTRHKITTSTSSGRLIQESQNIRGTTRAVYGDEKKMEEVKNLGRGFNNEQKIFSSS